MINETDWAWAAGFFDGEGYIDVDWKTTQLRISQSDRRPLDRFQSITGLGSVRVNKAAKDFYYWRVSSYGDVVKVLEQMWPYMSEPKKEDAILKFLNREIERQNRGILNRAQYLTKSAQEVHGI